MFYTDFCIRVYKSGMPRDPTRSDLEGRTVAGPHTTINRDLLYPSFRLKRFPNAIISTRLSEDVQLVLTDLLTKVNQFNTETG